MVSLSREARDLIRLVESYRRVVVALSGGVDSSVVAAAAVRSRLDDPVAVTAVSPSVSQWQLDWAKRIANQIGIRHELMETREGFRREYRRNDDQRCFYCKETLYETLQAMIDRADGATIVSGTNADDLDDFRPGIRAGRIADVKTPLADLGITKSGVRALASEFGLSNADLPASPCLASRIAYGVEVTPERLARIEQAESWLRRRGFGDLRVRLHQHDLARVEVTAADFSRFGDHDFAVQLHRAFCELGFRYVTFDLGGLQSGSMNPVFVSLGDSS